MPSFTYSSFVGYCWAPASNFTIATEGIVHYHTKGSANLITNPCAAGAKASFLSKEREGSVNCMCAVPPWGLCHNLMLLWVPLGCRIDKCPAGTVGDQAQFSLLNSIPLL